MAKSDFIPPRDAAFLGWHDQLKAAATTIGATLGITAADLTGLADDNELLHATFSASADLNGRAQQATQEKNTAKRTAEQKARTLAKRLKLHSAYNAGFGQQLGIEGSEATVDLTAAKPQLEGAAKPHGEVELTFNKSKSDGVNIYGQRDGDAGFVFLARDTSSPYIDNRPCLVAGKPELRRYKAIYILDDQEVGQFSDEVPVTCQP